MSFHLRLQDVARLKKFDQKDIADGLDIFPATVNRWWHGKVKPRGKSLRNLAEFLGCNSEWLETGKGQMFGYQPPPGDNIRFNFGKPAESTQTPNTTAHVDLDVSSGTSNASPSADGALPSDTSDDEEIPIEDMVLMTREVLASRTVYRSALASNVRAFHQAVKKEEQMKTTNDRLDAMTAEMAEMKAMLKALLNPAQKRDQKAG